MQRAILRKVANSFPERLQCGSLPFNSAAVILGSIASFWLLPIHPAMGQSRTFQGVQVSQKFNPKSEMAQLIEASTTKQSKNSQWVTVRLGRWVPVPRSKDNYYTYETRENPKLEIKTYSIYFLADTTSDNPRLLSYGVRCAENKMRPIGYRSFYSSGHAITREIVNEPWATPTNRFLQGLANQVCRLRV